MKKYAAKFKLIAVVLFFSVVLLHAEVCNIPSLYRYKLKNGLELFVAENDSAPLAYIEIAVRAGAVTQQKENAGLFHFYEHMMFKGNKKFKNQQESIAALNRMGVSNWNGTTGIDRVNYYFTVPSNLVKDGLEYWSYAIRTPLLDKTEFENEKNVVIAEIAGGRSEPSRIFAAGMFRSLFPDSPWRLDSSGTVEIIRNATVEQLRKIQDEYYVPENTALFVGGAVHHEEIFAMVQEIYGSWQNGSFAKGGSVKVSVPSKTPVKNDKKIVFPDPRTSGNILQFVYYLRGPDAETDSDDTYAADVWAYLLGNPSGAFLSLLVNDEKLQIPDADYAGGGYTTMRASGMISFSAAMLSGGELSAVQKSERLLKLLKNQGITTMLSSGTGFDLSDIQKVKSKLEDNRIYSLETAQKFLSGLSAVWASSGADYFLSYEENISKVTEQDIKDFVKKYVQNKAGIAVLFVSPAYYEQHKDEFKTYGYEVLNSENAFWWSEQ